MSLHLPILDDRHLNRRALSLTVQPLHGVLAASRPEPH
jgi:hypothetical protein